MDDFDFEDRKRGRPKSGRKPQLRATIRKDLFDRVTDHADEKFLSFGEAVEDLLERGLRHAEED